MRKCRQTRNLKRWSTILLAIGLSIGMALTARAGGWARLSNTSPWKGTFIRSDGRKITITDTDRNTIFISLVSDRDPTNFETDMLMYRDGTYAAVSNYYADGTIRYTLDPDTGCLHVDAAGSYDPGASGDYYRAARKSCWEYDGTWFFYDTRGNKLINGVTTDGWYTGANGQWRRELGMACFTPGTYRNYCTNENTENEKWEFSVYTDMSWEDWTLHSSSDKREVGRVDYTYMDFCNNPIYVKEDMILYNTMDGYVIEDVSGQIFAWMYPMGQTIDQNLMIQPYGSEQFHHIYLNSTYDQELTSIPEMHCYDILCNSPALQSKFRIGLQVLYDQSAETINGETCYLFSLGTNREDQFVREYHYAVSESQKIYEQDVITDQWKLIENRRM